jgi:F-type H+-transporting ATPase subunit a
MQETVGTHPLWHLPHVPPPFNTVHADTVIVTWITMVFAILAVGLLASTHPITVVSKRYSVMELLVSFLADTTTGILGRAGLPFVPFIISLFLFILLLNEIGLFPLIGKSPTADLNTTAALAITTILLIQIVGISKHGLGYYKHLIIKPLLLGLLLLPINIIDELARPVTLTLRLFGNIFVGELLLVVVGAIIVAGIVLAFHVLLPIGIAMSLVAAFLIASYIRAKRSGSVRKALLISGLVLGTLGIVITSLGASGVPLVLPVSTLARVAPIIIYVFNLLVGVIQAAVFTLLTIAYLITPTQESLEH